MDATNTTFSASEQPPDQANSLDTRLGAIAGALGFSALLLVVLLLIQAVRSTEWQFYVLAAAFAQTSIFGLVGLSKANQGEYDLKGLGWLSGSFAWTALITAGLLEGIAIPVAVIYLVYALIVTATISTLTRGAITIILGLVVSTLVALVGAFFPGFQVATPQADIFIPGLLAIVIMIYVTLLAIQFVSAPLQVRLTTSFLAVVIIPLAISSVIQNQVASSRLREETFSSLKSAADEVSIVLDNFIAGNMNIISIEADNPAFSEFLAIPNYDPNKAIPENNMRAALKLLETRESSERKFLSSYALLNKDGRNVFDTTEKNIGELEGNNDYFRIPLETGEPYYSPVLFDQDGNAYLYFSAPVKDKNRRDIIGVLRSRYNALVLQRLATSYSRLITFFSHAVIYDENLIRLADDYQPILVYTPVMDILPEKVQELQSAGRMPNLSARTYTSNPELARLLTVSRPGDTSYTELERKEEDQRQLPEMIAFSAPRLQPWKVVYLKANFDQQLLEKQQARSAILVASIMSLLVGLIAIGASRILSGPIFDLTQTAREVTSGNLDALAVHTGNDEFGTLGSAFNLMTARLRQSINELEVRVSQRTFELERRNETLTYRSTQLQTVAEVARGVATSQQLEDLLTSITELVSSRFGFYHVGIFLLDDSKELAVLRAANSEGGKRMLNRKHALKVGKVGIVGYVTGLGRPRIATDVGEDAVFFNNPDLPLTRSEMALPLQVSGQVIGALDVQSTQSNAFSSEDISLFTILADQVAIAIQNNQLFVATIRALSETQEIHRQYMRQEWRAEAATRRNRAYRYTPQGLVESEPALLSIQGDESFQTGEPISISETMPDGTTRLVMEVPIILRGEMIGAIRVQDQSVYGAWSDDETQAVRDIAQQVGVALEAARLFEKTMQRAERERKVLEITGRIRATNDPQEMLEIAVAELQRSLGATRAQIIFRQNEKEAVAQTSPNPSRGEGEHD
jgi:GAF domain-containing protein/HAMP domain-containing protein